MENNVLILNINLDENYNMSYILKIFEDASIIHGKLLNVSYSDMLKKNLHWIILKTKYEIIKKYKKGNYFIKTWPLEKKHYEYEREYEIYDESNNIYVVGSIVYSLIDKNTRKISNYNVYNFNCLKKRVFNDRIRLLKHLDKNEMSFIDKHLINQNNIDSNNHLNNKEYLKILENFISLDVIKLEVNYNKEVLLNDELYFYKKDNIIQGYINDLEISFIAKLN